MSKKVPISTAAVSAPGRGAQTHVTGVPVQATASISAGSSAGNRSGASRTASTGRPGTRPGLSAAQRAATSRGWRPGRGRSPATAPGRGTRSPSAIQWTGPARVGVQASRNVISCGKSPSQAGELVDVRCSSAIRRASRGGTPGGGCPPVTTVTDKPAA
ncbi:hypothetical protein ADK70_19985 [Streptomyces rimosus subsp. pseudoverticillatus]|nr:hypothetical protein [Streptomyces rimosus]KOT86950.1 hypothetical protein ADK70_19985 [Streptomyces rimosus subsp. pseudoverticillatus]